jgi:hypothetical protein
MSPPNRAAKARVEPGMTGTGGSGSRASSTAAFSPCESISVRESSFMGTLQELALMEEERIAREKAAERAARDAKLEAQRKAEAEARARADAERQRVEEQERQASLRSREEQARIEAMQRAIVEAARVEAEGKARVEEAALRSRGHAQEAARVAAAASRATKIVGVLAFVVIAVQLGVYLGVLRPHADARLAQLRVESDGRVAELAAKLDAANGANGTLADDNTHLRADNAALAGQIQDLKDQLARRTTVKTPHAGTVAAPTTTATQVVVPNGFVTTCKPGSGDPMCFGAKP